MVIPNIFVLLKLTSYLILPKVARLQEILLAAKTLVLFVYIIDDHVRPQTAVITSVLMISTSKST